MKRWLEGTHQGSVSAEHRDNSLNEFTFRLNCCTAALRGKLFYRLAQQAVQREPGGLLNRPLEFASEQESQFCPLWKFRNFSRN
jgi:hypothetical protein